MVDIIENKKRIINEFTENYTAKLFYFCLKKTGNSYDAEDLASDIALNIIASLEKGTVPMNFSAWVWQVARNRYSAWADQKRKRCERFSDNDISEHSIEDTNSDIENELIHSEELSLLRRELAFISSEYRDILIAYYIDDRKTKDIAKTLNLPEGTVLSKLHRARKILKEGMIMAREFGIKSYKPEDIDFSSSGRQPSGLPWSAVQRKIPKNILIEASNNPSTVEELSIELGIAVPYIEEEVKLLTDATLLKKLDNGKYITDFYIASAEVQLGIYNAQRKDSLKRSKMIDKLVADCLPEVRKLGIVKNNMSDNDLKWLLIPAALESIMSPVAYIGINNMPTRANGENWGFIGYEDVTLPEVCLSGHNGAGSENEFWMYAISDWNMWSRVGLMEPEGVNFLTDVILNNRKIESFTHSESLIWKDIKDRFAHEENGYVVPDIVVIDNSQYKVLTEMVHSHELTPKLTEMITDLYNEVKDILSKNSTSVLKEQLDYCAGSFMTYLRMMTIRDEVNAERLIVPEKPEKSTVAMWLRIDA